MTPTCTPRRRTANGWVSPLSTCCNTDVMFLFDGAFMRWFGSEPHEELRCYACWRLLGEPEND